VHGRTVELKAFDDGYVPARALAGARRLVREDKVFAMLNAIGTPTHQAAVGFLNGAKVPDLFVGSGCPCWNDGKAHPWTFGFQPDYVVEGKILGSYLRHRYPGKRFGYFFQNDDFGRSGVRGLDHVIPKSKVVARESYRPGHVNIAKQARRLQAAHADVVVAFTVPAFTALLRLNLVRLNFAPVLAVSNVGSDPTTVAGLLASIARTAHTRVNGRALVRGIVTDGFLPAAGDRANSWIRLFRQVHDRYIPSVAFDGNVVYGMAVAYTFVEALRAAGDDPTRQDVVDAIAHGLAQGPGLVPFGYDGADHRGLTGAQIGIVDGRRVVYRGRPQVTDDGTGAVTPYGKPAPTAPPNGIPTG
jgi:ABC-type branched-subunit amino acid transport system substrate-binding protein